MNTAQQIKTAMNHQTLADVLALDNATPYLQPGRKMNDAEKAAAASARLANSAVCDVAYNCKHADLDGSEVTDALRTASQALLHLLNVIEGRT
jgi:hypothetical protein